MDNEDYNPNAEGKQIIIRILSNEQRILYIPLPQFNFCLIHDILKLKLFVPDCCSQRLKNSFVNGLQLNLAHMAEN